MIEVGSQPASREDRDVGAALLELFHDEGIEVLLGNWYLAGRGAFRREDPRLRQRRKMANALSKELIRWSQPAGRRTPAGSD